jgi:isopenicillin N synthase-like dioxygenase
MNSSRDTAELQSLRLTDLQKGLPCTRNQLLDVCVNEGFFYLEIDDHGSSLEETMESQMNFAKRVFDVSDDEKGRYNFKTTGRPSTSGYVWLNFHLRQCAAQAGGADRNKTRFKAARTETGAFGKPDGFELYMVS